jgi:hypothetical protein
MTGGSGHVLRVPSSPALPERRRHFTWCTESGTVGIAMAGWLGSVNPMATQPAQGFANRRGRHGCRANGGCAGDGPWAGPAPADAALRGRRHSIRAADVARGTPAAAPSGADLVSLRVPPALSWLRSLSTGLIVRAGQWREDGAAAAFSTPRPPRIGPAPAGRLWCIRTSSPSVLRSAGAGAAGCAGGDVATTRHHPDLCRRARRLAAACERPVLLSDGGRRDLTREAR